MTSYDRSETRSDLFGVLADLSVTLGAAYHVPFQVLLDTKESVGFLIHQLTAHSAS